MEKYKVGKLKVNLHEFLIDPATQIRTKDGLQNLRAIRLAFSGN